MKSRKAPDLMKRYLLTTLMICSAKLALAEVHKWVDENGTVVYSQTLPSAVPSETVRPPPPPAEDPEAAQAALQEQIDRLDKARVSRQTTGAVEAAGQKQKAEDEKACAEARDHLAKLEQRPQVLLVEADGSSRRLDYEELEAKRAEARAQVEEFCGDN